jgi:hypothetical protein
VRLPAVLLVVVFTLSACATTRSAADQQRDARAIAASIRALDDAGSNFSMQENLRLTGGDIPKGQAEVVKAQASGAVRSGNARMTYKIQQQQGSIAFDMIIGKAQLFVRPAGATQVWRSTPANNLTALYPAVRVDLVREAVLLAKTVSGYSLAHLDQGFAHKYTVTPASDQLEQFESIAIQTSQEAAFLKGAKAEIDVFLSTPGDHLMRIEVHLSGTDQDNGQTQKVDCVVDFKGGKVGLIGLPIVAQPVQPGEALAP